MAEMFGAPVGDVIGVQTVGRGLANLQTLGEIAQQPAQLESRLLANEKLRTEMETNKKLAALASNIFNPAAGPQGTAGATPGSGPSPSGRPPSMADAWDRLAAQAAGAGSIEQARKLSETAALLRSRDASADARRASAAKSILDAQVTQADAQARLLGDVQSQDDWEQAAAIYQVQYGRPAPWAGVQFDPQLRDQFRNAAISVKDQAELQRKTEEDEARNRYRSGRLAQHERGLALQGARLAIIRAREERLAKTGGGKEIAPPGRADVDYTTNLLKKDFPELDITDRKEAAYDIASAARELIKRNPALTRASAIQQAITNAQQAGMFSTSSTKIDMLGLEWGKKTKYTGRGRTPETAVPVPSSASDRTVGMYYTSPTGQVAKWTGKGWEVTGRALTAGNGRPAPAAADVEEEEEEDE